jgi:hypothetical protein
VNSIAVKAGFSVHISSSRRHGTMSNVLGGMKKATPSATKKNGALTAVYTQNGEDIMKPSGLYPSEVMPAEAIKSGMKAFSTM